MGLFPCELPEGIRQNVRNLGVSMRHLIKRPSQPLKGETVLNEDDLVGLCSEACERATEEASMSMRDIDYLIVTYDVNPFLSPGLSQILAPTIGLDHYIKHVNIQGIASTAFPKALELARDHIAAHPTDNVMICVSGVSSYWFQNQVNGLDAVLEIGKISQLKNDAEAQLELRKWIATMQFFLFGDGVAAAVAVDGEEGLTVKKTTEVTNLEKKDYLAGYSRLTALNEPFKFGFQSYLDKEIPTLGAKYTDLAIRKVLGKESASLIKRAKKWAIHTGSEKILDLLAEHHEIRPEKIAESHQVLKELGNLAGASLPFILERIVRNGLSAGDLILMVGYGWGFSATASLLEFSDRQK